MRFAEAPDLQYGAFLDGELVGFVCSTRADGPTLTHESMGEHRPGGASVCIHSVCVEAAHRRKGVASALLRGYLKEVSKANQFVDRMHASLSACMSLDALQPRTYVRCVISRRQCHQWWTRLEICLMWACLRCWEGLEISCIIESRHLQYVWLS
jgi:GNAT superfamily N-acetyltransferase